MASTFSDLGIELMATGENAGTWGTKTNTNLEIIEKSIAGYVEQAVTSGGTTALSITDGDTTESTSVARHAVIKLTGTITGNSIVTVPDSIEKVYIVTNGTSGAYTVQFKTASGTGITFGVSEKTTRLVYSDGTNLIDAGFGGSLDIEGRELVLDADGDTTLTADTDDQIDIKIAGADDFQFTANTFTAQSGSSIVVPDGGLTFGSTAITSTAAELNLLDGVSGLVQADFTKLAAVDSTAAELNIVDGGTSATSTTVADADRVVLNDNGTMVQVAVTDLAAYFDDEITAMPNLVTTAATTVGALNSGSITSGFGTIDTGSSTITTTGLITGGSLDIDDVLINGTTIGHTDDTDLITLANGVATVAGEISVTTLDIGGTNVTATAAEINLIDGGTARGTTAVADADGILHNDNGTMRMTSAATFKTYFTSGISSAADDITAGDSAVTISTSSGDITIDAAANDSDIIFKGTDATADITMLTLDGSDAGTATFNHDIILGNNSFIQFGDAGENILGNGTDLTINSSNDLHLTATTDINIPANVGLTFGDDGEKIEGDGTNLTVSSSGNFIIDAVSVINLDADSNGNVNLKDGGTKFGSFKSSSSDFVITSEVQDKDIIFKGDDNASAITALTLDMSDAGAATFNDKVTIGDGKLVLNSTAVTSTAAELNLLDGVSGLVQADLTKLAAVDSTAAELNIVDGGTSATSTTVADADRVVLNDNGTMVQVAVTDLAAYFDDEITAMPNLVTTAATTVGALNSGSITSGFGTIDTGSSTITTTGLISGGSLDIDNVLINGTTIGHTDDTDLLTVADGLLTVAGEISVTTLDIGGTNIASTAAELNIVDGNTSATSTTVADADRVVLNDNGTMVQVAMTDIKTYIGGGTSWQAVKTGDFTAAAGQGVFCNTTSAAFTLTLPAGSIGDEVSFVDYAGTFDTNNLTIASNGSEKIHGSTDNLTIAVERAANTLVFTDSTQGWLLKSK